LNFESAVWAARKGLELVPRRDLPTLAMSVSTRTANAGDSSP
jgi:hypothetical protein